MTAATNPDTGRITAGYITGVGVFATVLIGALLYIQWRANGRSVEAWLDQQIAKKRARARAALARGDAHILRAITEHEASRRATTPRQPERTAR